MMAKPTKLVVVVPGLGGKAARWEALLKRLKGETHLLDGVAAHWRYFEHRKGLFGFGSARNLSRRFGAFINETDVADGPFDEIILVAHSMGGLIVRDAYLRAASAYNADSNSPNPWAGKVSKFILFAALSRGFDPESRFWYRVGVSLARLSIYRWMILNDLTRGSPFVTDLRLAWIRHFRRFAGDKKEPVVVQFLGTSDTMVRREDCLDTEQFPNSATIDISEADHNNLFQLEAAPDLERRYALISAVFKPDYATPAAAAVINSEQPRKIVFVLHGIRAENIGWVEEVSAIIRKADSSALPIPAQYGYFSALHFFLPWVRRARARWFQDRYGELAAKYSNAETKFYFIGHSNGTYMLGRGLQAVTMMRFERAYIAGSVLPATYPWSARVASGQIGQLRSDGSASDWPVGLLCSALSFMGDIGTGGFAGFQAGPSQLTDHRYYPGGHSKPLEDRKNLEEIVKYVLTGEDTKPEKLGLPSTWFAMLSRALRYVGPLILIGLVALLVFLLWTHGAAFSFSQWALAIGVAFTIIVFLLSL